MKPTVLVCLDEDDEDIAWEAGILLPEVFTERFFTFLEICGYSLELGDQPRLVARRLHLKY